MLTQEEIRIKAGLDYSKVTAGLTDVRRQVYKLASDVPKQLGNIFKATVFGAASTLISNLIPSIEELWQKWTGTDPETMRRKSEMNDDFHAMADQVGKSKKNLQAVLREERIRNATIKERLAIANQELAAEQRNMENNRDKLEYYQRQKDELEQQLVNLKAISKEKQLYNTGLPGGPVLGSTPRAQEAAGQIPGIEEAINQALHNIAGAQTGVNESSAKLSGLRGARDSASKEVLQQYLKFADQNSYQPKPGVPMKWEDQVAAKNAAWQARGPQVWTAGVAKKLSNWQQFGMHQPPTTPNQSDRPPVVQVEIVAINAK